MKNNVINDVNKIATNLFLVKRYTPLLEVSEDQSRMQRIRLLIAKGHYKFFNLLYPGRPWTSPASILFFDKFLNRKMIGLEYGSGRSTFYFAKKLKHLVSIEHHEGWANTVKKQLLDNKIVNVDYHLIPEENVPLRKEDLDIYMNQNNEYGSKKNFENYYQKVNEYPNNYFDFVLIDGRSRVRCGLNAIDKLKPGGVFVLDNSERERYLPLHSALETWPKANTTNGFMDTTIWVKPL